MFQTRGVFPLPLCPSAPPLLTFDLTLLPILGRLLSYYVSA